MFKKGVDYGGNMAEKVKSDLQKRLEAEGWEFLTNDNSNRVGGVVFGSLGSEEHSLSDGFLRKKYLDKKSFPDVHVADAYDVHGNPLPTMRAVYVKRNSKGGI